MERTCPRLYQAETPRLPPVPGGGGGYAPSFGRKRKSPGHGCPNGLSLAGLRGPPGVKPIYGKRRIHPGFAPSRLVGGIH